jgi:hypothetical protein
MAPCTPGSDEPLIEGMPELPPGAFDLPSAEEGLKAMVLARTTAAVRIRRHRRRLGMAIGVLLTYAVGFGSACLWTASTSPGVRGDEAVEPRVERTQPTEQTPPPGEIERRALPAPREERMRLLKLAGDRYLGEEGDVEGAVRCYGKYLDLVWKTGAAPPTPADNWLLIAMKNSRL